MPNKTQSNLVYQLIFFTGFILYLFSNSQGRYIKQKPLTTSQDYPLSTKGTRPLVMKGGNPYIRALMRTITASEANVKQPYNVIYGGSLVDDLTSHPDRSWYHSSPKLTVFRKISKQLSFPAGIGIPGRVWVTQQCEWIEDVNKKESKVFFRNEATQEVGLKTALAVPIIADKEVIAVFVFFDFSARTLNETTVALVKSIASQLGLIMERKRAEGALYSSMATNKAILDAIPDLIFRINREGVFVIVISI